ncbi:hypothetical protein RND71_008489 [Anisodus tanguticus]|uniref:Uncharacterized protein n=1 Tax=Anisodus tanguticus TaxID=243964 RepID=A0AAE1VUB4_9SOLA|nr:hypothetical protein RND71_008489 [Anisodus tanguticus]
MELYSKERLHQVMLRRKVALHTLSMKLVTFRGASHGYLKSIRLQSTLDPLPYQGSNPFPRHVRFAPGKCRDYLLVSVYWIRSSLCIGFVRLHIYESEYLLWDYIIITPNILSMVLHQFQLNPKINHASSTYSLNLVGISAFLLVFKALYFGGVYDTWAPGEGDPKGYETQRERINPATSRLTGKTSGKSAKPSPDLSRLDESTSDISSLIDPWRQKKDHMKRGTWSIEIAEADAARREPFPL